MNQVSTTTLPITALVDSLEATANVAAELASLLTGPALVLLHGTLGSGKTTFVRSLCAALGMQELWEVDSPTFTIVNYYNVGDGFYHLDLYRLDPQQMHGVDLEEILESGSVVAIEWPDRLPLIHFDGPVFLVQIENHDAENQRRIHISEHQL